MKVGGAEIDCRDWQKISVRIGWCYDCEKRNSERKVMTSERT